MGCLPILMCLVIEKMILVQKCQSSLAFEVIIKLIKLECSKEQVSVENLNLDPVISDNANSWILLGWVAWPLFPLG